MNTSQYLSEEELIERAVKALLKALGPVETMRFLALPSQPGLDIVVNAGVHKPGVQSAALSSLAKLRFGLLAMERSKFRPFLSLG